MNNPRPLVVVLGLIALACNAAAPGPSTPANSIGQVQRVPSAMVEDATSSGSPDNNAPISNPTWLVDFRDFTFPGFWNGKRFRLHNGKSTSHRDNCIQEYELVDVQLVDFTNDNEFDALVHITDWEACGSSWLEHYYYLYTSRRGRPHLAWRFATGSEAHGGLKDFTLDGKELVFDLYGKWRLRDNRLEFFDDRAFKDDCCPTHVTTARFAWSGGTMEPKSVVMRPFDRQNIYGH